MNKDIADKWVAELRSGQHQQAYGKMKRANGAMCCLGVLEEVVLGRPVSLEQCYMSREGRDLAGLRSAQGDRNPPGSEFKLGDGEYKNCLAYENDEKSKSFAEIADIIEAEWETL